MELKRFDNQLQDEFEKNQQYRAFLDDPKYFRSLTHVIDLLNESQMYTQFENRENKNNRLSFHDTPTYQDLKNKKAMVNDIIQHVIRLQHSGLNLAVDRLAEVASSYAKSQKEINSLRSSLDEAADVLSNKSSSEILRNLWLKKTELQESLRIVKNIEFLKEAPPRINNLILNRRYLAAVVEINKSNQIMFDEDLIKVEGLSGIRDAILELKEIIVGKLLFEIQEAIYGGDEEVLTYEEEEDDEDDNVSVHSKSDRSSVTGFETLSVFESNNFSNINNNNNNNNNLNNNGMAGELMSDMGAAQFTNLKNLNENIENNIPDPSKTGSLFITLLVKAISELGKEDDFERLIFNDLSIKFKNKVIKYQRNLASQALKAINEKDKSEMMNDGDEKSDRKSMNLNEYNDIANATNNITNNNKVEVSTQTKIFSSYVSNLLSQSSYCLKRVFFVLRLISFSQVIRSDAANAAKNNKVNKKNNVNNFKDWYVMKEVNKTDVKSWWREVEAMICNELRVHLREMDVEFLMDQVSGKRKEGRNDDNELDNNDEEDEENEGMASPLVSPSAKLATPLHKKVYVNYEALKQIVIEEGLYTHAIDYKTKDNKPSASNNNNLNNSGGEIINPYSGLTVLEQLSNQRAQSTEPFNSSLVEFLDSFVESDLLPLTQSRINAEMRALQMDSNYYNFTLQIKQLSSTSNQNSSLFSSPVRSAPNQSNQSNVFSSPSNLGMSSSTSFAPSLVSNSINLFQQRICLNSATVLCSRSAQQLFSYWYELQSHADMVTTILDRLVRGFVSYARVEVENCTFKSFCGDVKYNKQIRDELVSTSLFLSYRKKLYNGRQTIQEIIAKKMKLSKNFSSFGFSIGSTTLSNSKAQTFMKSENEREKMSGATGNVWGLFIGAIGSSSQYPLSRADLLQDMSYVETLASILQGADWLSYELIRYCDAAVKKFFKDLLQSRPNISAMMSSSFGSLENDDRIPSTVNFGKDNGASQQEGQSSLPAGKDVSSIWSVTESVSEAMSGLAEFCLSLLACEARFICFLHLHQLASVTSLKALQNRARALRTQRLLQEKGEKDEESERGEADIILSDLTKHLRAFHEAMKPFIAKDLVAVIFFPLCSLIPKILLRCVQSLINPHSLSNDYNEKTSSSTIYSPPIRAYIHICLSTQELFLQLFSSLDFLPSAQKLLSDKLYEELEKLRRFVKLIELKPEELSAFVRDNNTLFLPSEFASLWDCMSARSDKKQKSFEDFWAQVCKKSL